MIKNKAITFVWVILLFLLQGSAFPAKEKAVQEQLLSCTFSASSINKTSISGIKLSRGMNFSLVSEVGSILAGNPSSVPLEFTINLDVENPNAKKMTITEYEYILRVDNVHLAQGVVKKSLKVPPGKKKSLPVAFNIDLASLVTGSSAGAVQNMVRNFMGSGNKPTNITLQIKPSYKVGKEVLSIPTYIPIRFSFQRKR